MNTIKIIFAVTYFWAYVGYTISRIFMFIFMLLMKLPICLPDFMLNIENTYNQHISILEAKTDKLDITNKFKIFLKLYMENAMDKKGVDFRNFINVFNSSILYCCYIIANETHSIIVEKIEDKFIKTKDGKKEELPMKTLYFDGDKKDEEVDLDELATLLNSFN